MIKKMVNKFKNADFSQHKLLWAALGIGFLIALWIQWPLLQNIASVNDDLRNLYWLHRMVDSTLFNGDVLIGHQLLEFIIGTHTIVISKFSPGFGALFFFSRLTGSIILFSKLLIFPLMLFSVFYLYRLAIQFTTKMSAFALCFGLALLNLFFSSNITVVAGLQRSFVLPFLLALLYYLTKQHYWRAAFVLLLSSSIYPPMFILGSATFGISLVNFSMNRPKEFSIEWKPLVPLLTAVLLGGLLLLPALSTQGNDQIAISLNQTHSFFDLDSLQGGRYPLFSIFPYIGSGGFFGSAGDGLNVLIMTAIAVGIKLLLKQNSQPVPRIMVQLLTASILCFCIAWLGILFTKSFPIYFPSRYTQTTIVLYLLFYIVLNGASAMQLAAQKLFKHSHNPSALILIVSIFIIPVLIYGWFKFPDRALYLNFAGGLAFLWLSIIVLLSVRKFSKSSPQAPIQTYAKPATFSPKNWVILGAFIFVALATYGRLFNQNVKPTNSEFALFSYLETLPKDIRLGGTPCALNNIPLFAKRMIFFSCETPHANPLVMQEALESYYATEPQTVNLFCQKYGLDYLVIDQNSFSDTYIQKGKFLFEPFDSLMKQQLSTRENFALNNLAPENILFQGGSLFVTACPLP